MDAMSSWKHESQFGDFIQESSTFPTAPPSPGLDHRPSQPHKEDLEAFQRTLEQVQKVEAHLKHEGEDSSQIQNLASFLKGSRKISPTLSIAHQFDRLRSLRDWLFWVPVHYLQSQSCSPNSMVAIAHLYTVALLMERMFPEIGSAYFGSLSLVPIEEIARRLMSICISGEVENTFSPALKLMEFPINAVGEFRSRMGWVQPERTRSFPQFNPPNFPVYDNFQQYDSQDSYALYGNPAFSYSTEEMPVLNASGPPSGSPVAPLAMPSPYASQNYLSIPSPMYGGAYSPASSTFEGSVTYSDSEDYGTFDMSGLPAGQSQQYYGESHNSFGLGFVSPNQPVWI
jgi:hypothetical protein